jgi:perosamine synthetase
VAGLSYNIKVISVFQPFVRTEEVLDELRTVFNSGWIGMGPKVEEFEEKICKRVGSDYFVATNSCTAALHLSLKVLNLPEKSIVLTSPVTCPAPNSIIVNEGHAPLFYDIDRTGNINLDWLEDNIRVYHKAIIICHYGGYSCDMTRLEKICKEYDVKIIEDCAHAFGSTYEGKPIGSSNNLCCFSFDYLKNMTTVDGGGVATSDPDYARRIKEMSWWGGTKHTYKRVGKEKIDFDYDIVEPGYKYHMNDVNAAIGLVQLRHLKRDNAQRKLIAYKYQNEIKNLEHPKYENNRESSYHLYPLFSNKKDELITYLNKNKIKPGHHYPRNDYYSAFWRFRDSKLTGVKDFCDKQLTLPIHPGLDMVNVEYIINKVNNFTA